MTTRTATTPLERGAVTLAYNISHTRLAVFDQDGQLSSWRRDGDTRDWVLSGSWEPQGQRVTTLCWAAPEFGSVVCSGGADGSVCLWAEAAGGWELRARLAESGQGVLDVAFAPREMGPVVAAAYADGFVRLFEASAPLDAPSWDLHSELRAGEGGRACTSVSWRGHDPALPPLLAAGTAGGGVQVWMFRRSLLRWERAAQLGSAADDYQGCPVAAVAWAPTLGRPAELVAAAAGTRVVLWALRGAADALEAERVAVLEHEHGVWQLGWNLLGSWLAASTEGGEVCMWRPDLSGEWLLLNKIQGGGAAAEDGDMLT
jgi:WD40 repeat protein